MEVDIVKRILLSLTVLALLTVVDVRALGSAMDFTYCEAILGPMVVSGSSEASFGPAINPIGSNSYEPTMKPLGV